MNVRPTMRETLFNKKKFIFVLIMIGGAILGIAVGTFFAFTYDLPQIRSLENYKPSAITKIYSGDRVLLAELFVERRDPVPLDIIPHYLIAAIIATEDRNFYNHSGIDLKGILRAIAKDLQAGEFVEGASTITQQLSKTLFLTPQKTITRKIKEAFLSFQLERRYTKDEIMELYLNQVYFGSGAYGVNSAAKIFFGKPIRNLTLSECALIAAMPKAPSRYSPLVNRPLAKKRRNIVLKQMFDTGIIPINAYKKALKEPIQLKQPDTDTIKAPYFVEYVKKILEYTIGSTILYKGGLTVYTTLSYEFQKIAEQAVSTGISDLENRMKKSKTASIRPQGALVSLDVQTGEILAMVGGNNYYESAFNRATSARRQPGSAFKPFVYAHAIERGFPQNRLILDSPVIFKEPKNGTDWRPENFSEKYQGEITLRKALAISENIPAVRLIEMLGPPSVVQFAYHLGIESTLAPNLSLALGTSETTLIELTSAYAVFPNRGKLMKPYGVIKILDHNGRILRHFTPVGKVAMSRTDAAIITNMLEGVIKEGTGKKARVLKQPLAGKTGTTNDFRDALFVGFSPSIATGVWVGQDNFASLGKWETGAKAALPVWIEFMKKTLEKRPYQYFDIPDDTARVFINPTNGRVASDHSPGAVAALFKKGTEPK